MKEVPQISNSELIIMKVLWENSPATANDIMNYLSKTTDWKPTTIKTLLSRLAKKKVISFEEENRTYYYYPLVKENEYVKTENKSFLKRVYGGALKVMIANFLETEELSDEDIDELKSILNEKKER